MEEFNFEENLIKTVEMHPLLYNSKHVDYRNVIKRRNTWHSIGRILGIDSTRCQTRWKSLRARYKEEIKISKKRHRNKKYWPLQPYLEFLHEHVCDDEKAQLTAQYNIFSTIPNDMVKIEPDSPQQEASNDTSSHSPSIIGTRDILGEQKINLENLIEKDLTNPISDVEHFLLSLREPLLLLPAKERLKVQIDIQQLIYNNLK